MKFKKIFFYALLFTALFLFLSCQQEKQIPEPVTNNSAADTSYIQKISDINRSIEKLMLAGDYEALLKYFTKDILFLSPMSKEIRGIEALRKNYREQKESGSKVRSFSGEIEKIWMEGNTVYEYGIYGASGTVKNVEKPIAQTGYYFMMWEKQDDGSFLISYLIENLDFNPCN